MYKIIYFYITLLLINTTLAAEELQFPKTAQEIESALTAKPVLKPRSFNPNGRGVKDIVNDPPKVGALIQFDYNSSIIRPESYELLVEYANALKNGLKDKSITIAGHASSEGEEQYNLTLSQQRAESIKSFLLAQRLPNNPETRLKTIGFGESQPLESNETEAGKEKNRRVEFIAE